MPFAATQMDLEIVRLSEVSKTEKDRYHMTPHMWNLKYDRNELIYETETDSQIQRTDLRLPKGKGERRDKLGIWDQHTQTTI